MNLGLYKEVEGLVKFMSRRFGAVGHYALDPEELEAEGRLIFAKIYREQSDLPEPNFLALFKTSLYNHLKSLLDKHRYTSKRGFTKKSVEEEDQHLTDTYIDLSEVAEVLGYQAFAEVYYQEYVQAMFQMLKDLPDTYKLFMLCVNHPPELEDMVINESKRKACIAKQGHLVRNAEVVKVRQKHLAKYLGWTTTKTSDHLQILKRMASELIYGSDQNSCANPV